MRQLLEYPPIYCFFQNLLGAKQHTQKFVKEYINPFPNIRILDIGCGPGLLVDALEDNHQYTGFDLSKKYIKYAKKKYPHQNFICDYISPSTAPQFDHAFDVVLARGILHHLDDNESSQLIDCAYQHLTPQGKFITIDGVFLKKQHKLAQLFLSLDRGRFVRHEEEYLNLVQRKFNKVEAINPLNTLPIPYNHLIMVCQK